MRKAVLCILLLVATVAFGQQWQVVPGAVVSVFNQSAAVQPTVLLTPDSPGIYRLLMYFSVSTQPNNTPAGFYDATLQGTDITGLPYTADLMLSCKQSLYESLSPAISLKAGQPLTYAVAANGNLSGCNYNLTITVEKLVQ